MSATATLLKIGEVATSSGLPVKTVRYYEDIGLLSPTVERSNTGYRLFTPQIFDRLAFIKRAQQLGLSLSEIQQILAVYDQGNLPCGEVRLHLEKKVEEIAEQIRSLQTLQSELQGLLSGWQDQPTPIPAICPNLQS